MSIRDYLVDNILITDGAMGTYFSQITENTDTMSEKANLTQPELVEKIHAEYIKSGAKLIRTNTFAANSVNLTTDRDIIKNTIVKSYEIAKRAIDKSGKEVYLAADIGPIPESAFSDEDSILEEYKFICDSFLELGADIILFETFSDVKYIKPLVKYIKEKSNTFIITQYSLNRFGYTRSGISASRLLDELEKIEEIDAFGFNCGIGSGDLYRIMKGLNLNRDKIITAIPNSGYPEILQDRLVYLDNVDYFSERMQEISELGVNIIGGCCGTTPEYIKKLSEVIELNYRPVDKIQVTTVNKTKNRYTYINKFFNKLEQGKKVIAVELDPPFDAKISKLMEGAYLLKSANVDMITIADSPLGKPRADSIMTATKILNEVNIPVMPHVCCRDKNLIALKSQLLSAYMNDIRNLLLVTGDPIPSSDRNEITSVFDVNSIQLMNMVKHMNEEHFNEEPIYYGGALNPDRANIDKEIQRMKKKIEAGATYFLTQPIYDDSTIERIRYIKDRVDTKILCGILPLVNIKNARFIKNEIAGINIPDRIIDKYTEEMTREESEQVGIDISLETISKLSDIADGYYFMVPFNRVSMILKIIDKIRD